MQHNPFATILQYAGLEAAPSIAPPLAPAIRSFDSATEAPPVRLMFVHPETQEPKALHTHTLRRAEGLQLPAPLPFRGKTLTHLHFQGPLLFALFANDTSWTRLGIVQPPAHKATRKSQLPLVPLKDVLDQFT